MVRPKKNMLHGLEKKACGLAEEAEKQWKTVQYVAGISHRGCVVWSRHRFEYWRYFRFQIILYWVEGTLLQ